MKKINIARVFLSAFITGLVFLFMEIVVEGFTYLFFGISESKIFKEMYNIAPSGTLFHILNISIFFAECIVIMWVYAVIRPRFTSNVKAAFAVSLIFLIFVFLFIASQINLGIFPLKLCLMSLVFNLIELPVAVLIGSRFYKDK